MSVQMKPPSILAIDFDGTCVTHLYPGLGNDVGAQPVLSALVAEGHRLVLFTMRSGPHLVEARRWFSRNSIPLHGVNATPGQRRWTTSPKAHAALYIDDRGLGIPLCQDSNVAIMPFVDWTATRKLLEKGGWLTPLRKRQG